MSATPMPDYCKSNNLIPSSLALPPPSHLMMNFLAFKSVYQTGKIFRQLNPFFSGLNIKIHYYGTQILYVNLSSHNSHHLFP